MKTVCIAGNVGRDAEVRRTQSGDAVTSWSVAVEDRSAKEKSTIWFKCTLWGKRGEALAQFLTKGMRVAVSGELGVETYEGKTYLTLRADNVTLQSGRQDDAPRVEGQGFRSSPPAQRNAMDMDDTIPFAPEVR